MAERECANQGSGQKAPAKATAKPASAKPAARPPARPWPRKPVAAKETSGRRSPTLKTTSMKTVVVQQARSDRSEDRGRQQTRNQARRIGRPLKDTAQTCHKGSKAPEPAIRNTTRKKACGLLIVAVGQRYDWGLKRHDDYLKRGFTEAEGGA